jgi:hypothetical protein
MALAAYETLTQALLQAPTSPIPLIPVAVLDSYINQARLQVAAQGRCIRALGTLTLNTTDRTYSFSLITGMPAGIAAIYHVRQLWFLVGSGYQLVTSRPFEWFGLYSLNNPTPVAGAPTMWTQHGQGETGNIIIDPLPDFAYVCNVDVLAVPVTLVSDTTPEAIPAIWTLAVPFYAAWLAFMSWTRQADADLMMKHFQEQMAFARNAANPDLLPENWSQSQDLMLQNRLGIQAAKASG